MWANRLIATNSNNYCLGASILEEKLMLHYLVLVIGLVCFAGPIQDTYLYVTFTSKSRKLTPILNLASYYVISLKHTFVDLLLTFKNTIFHSRLYITFNGPIFLGHLIIAPTALILCNFSQEQLFWSNLSYLHFTSKLRIKPAISAQPYVLSAFYTFILKTPLWRSFIGHIQDFYQKGTYITHFQENPQYAGILSRYL